MMPNATLLHSFDNYGISLAVVFEYGITDYTWFLLRDEYFNHLHKG